MSDQSPAATTGVVLAATHADPDDSMLAQALRVLPRLRELYSDMLVLVSADTGARTRKQLAAHGVRVEVHRAPATIATLGLARRDLVGHAVALGAANIHLCDWDRVLHWAEQYPDELRDVVSAVTRHDLLILGRTARAFGTHPRVQRDTESLINHAFGLAFGQDLDVTAASRGLSRRAAELLVAQAAPEPSMGNDCAWPLWLAGQPGLIVGYARTEGLEWETPDRHADAITAAGGLDAWIANYDADPARWEFRVELALLEIQAINRWRRPLP